MKHVVVIGAGTMGHGIAQVFAMANISTYLLDNNEEVLANGLARVASNLDKGVARGKVTEEAREQALAHLHRGDMENSLPGANLVIEAVPERMDLKQSLFQAVAERVSSDCILATNTSSLSISTIASAIPHPERVIGMHFFNPVHIMALLEVVVGRQTSDAVLEAVQQAGERIGKEVIVVQDVPGFATSRLGVCLGMEAIRMVEQGVASAEDIDKAMVLGYRHPIGPLRLTDLVGLDVRMAIGSYLATELNNPAFSPPDLMKEMVRTGRLGKKTGSGFYDW